MKKILIFLFILFIPFSVFAKDNYAIDNADILSESTEKYILKYSNKLKKYNIDYYVVCVDDLDGYSINDYTDSVYKDLNISEKGVLILVSHSDREIRVVVGSELSEIISDDVIEDYLNSYFMPFLKNNDWDFGLKNGYSAFYKMIGNIYDINNDDVQVMGDSFLVKYKYPILVALIWIASLLGCLFFDYVLEMVRGNVNPAFLAIILFINVSFYVLAYYIYDKTIIIIFLFQLFSFYSCVSTYEYKRKKKMQRNAEKKLIYDIILNR